MVGHGNWTRATLMTAAMLGVSAGVGQAATGSEDAPRAAQRSRAKLQLAVGFDGHRTWISAQYRQLGIRKQTSREPRLTSIELRYGADTTTVEVGEAGVIVSRGTQSITVNSPKALGMVQELLAASPAAFAARAAISELAEESDLAAADMSLLSALAFVASLTGDVDAPRRLTDRFVAKHRGVMRPVRRATCWEEYTAETTAAWSDLQSCMDEADQDESFLRGAYRRLACNAVWLARGEAAWFEFLGCIQPMKAVK